MAEVTIDDAGSTIRLTLEETHWLSSWLFDRVSMEGMGHKEGLLRLFLMSELDVDERIICSVFDAPAEEERNG